MADSKQTPPIGDNPLVLAVLAVLKSADKPLAIHELLVSVKQEHSLPHLADDDQVALFRLNWLLMNALYQLQQDLWQDGLHLKIQTLSIELTRLQTGDESTDDTALRSDKLRDYYLDWQNFTDISREEVEAILNGVWQRYLTADQQAEAYAVLELESDVEWPVIQRRYRQLAARHHPDRGGDAAYFMRVREAYECLQKVRR